VSVLGRIVVAAALVAVVVPQPPAPEPVLAELDGPAAPIAPAVAPAANASIDELRAQIAQILDRNGIPGVGIALVGSDGPIYIGGVGVTDFETRRPVDADTVYRVGSITKSVVALGVMKLVDQHRLDLNQPIAELVPDAGITNAWEQTSPVTLGQVLEHTAGFDDMHFNEVFHDDDALSAPDALAINRNARVVRWEPGTRFSYSNVGYTLAARAIEVATGEPFDVWLRREVLAPLGMHADFRRTDELAAHLATGYVRRGRSVPFHPIAHRAAGALLASPKDLAQLVQMWLARSQVVVSTDSLARIERTGTLPYPHLDVEYGLGNHGDVSEPARGRGHDGGLPGFVSSLRYFPDLGVGYVMLLPATYSPDAYMQIRALLFAYVARGKTIAPPSTTAGAEPPAAGFYGFASPRNQLLGFVDRAIFGWRVAPDGDAVHFEPLLGGNFELARAPDGTYRAHSHSGTSLAFTHARDGTPIMVAGFAYCEAGSWTLARARFLALQIAMLLLQGSVLWAAGTLAFAAMQRRRPPALDLLLAPAMACLCMRALPWLVFEASTRAELGTVNAWTLGIFGVTIGFAIAGVVALAAVLRWSVRPDRATWTSRLVPNAACLATFALAVWLAAHGLVGLRMWSY
jgi:CubicO group peptidase (beta-lactamase class C family)